MCIRDRYIPGNDFDTRIYIIGEKAFGKIRFNKKDDFKASGSELHDLNPEKVDLQFIKLGFEITGKMGLQSCAIDCLWKNGDPKVVEMSYITVPKAKFNGYWDETLVWHEGQIWPEEAHVDEFLKYIKQRRNNQHS